MAADLTAPVVDDTEDTEADVEETEDDETGEEETPAWTPPTQEEWAAQQAKLKRANDQARKLREKTRTPAPPATGDQAAQGAASAADVEKWQTRAVRAAAKAELIGRGADPDMVDLALGRLRAGEVVFTDDEPELEDWLDEMEDRYPKLFAKAPAAAAAAPAPKPGRVNQGAAAAGRTAAPQLSLGEQILNNSQAATQAARRRG